MNNRTNKKISLELKTKSRDNLPDLFRTFPLSPLTQFRNSLKEKKVLASTHYRIGIDEETLDNRNTYEDKQEQELLQDIQGYMSNLQKERPEKLLPIIEMISKWPPINKPNNKDK